MLRIPMAGLALGLLLTLSAPVVAQEERPGEGATVRAAVADYQSAMPIEAIVSELLRELGYDVPSARTLAPPLFYQAVTLGDVDYWPNSWMPQQVNLLPDNFEENAAFVGTIVEKGAIQGYLASKDEVEEFGIESLADFRRPEVIDAFDPDGNGTIEMLGCNPGWACADIIAHHLETYDLEDVINVMEADYTAGFADVLARHRNGEPVLYYTWTPNFTLFEIPPGEEVLWINVPEIAPTEEQEGVVESMTASNVEGAVTDPIKLGFSANDIRVAANREFLEANPVARRLFEQIEIPLVDVSGLALRVNEGENSPQAVEAMAQEWIDDNRDDIDEWMEAARAAAP